MKVIKHSLLGISNERYREKNSVRTLKRTTLGARHQNMLFGPTFARVQKIGHKLEKMNVGRQAEPLFWAHLDSVDEQDFQQGEI